MSELQTLARGDSSLIVEPRRVVVRNEVAYAALWMAHAGPEAAAPPVDFASRMVAAVFLGQRPTPGHAVTITGVRPDGAGLAVLVDETQPAPGAVVPQVIVSPFHIVSLPATRGEVTFRQASGSIAATSARAGDERSSTGLRPPVAAALAYLAGPVSGALLLATEDSRFVRFHAWQAVLALGALGAAALLLLTLAFAVLVVSSGAFWTLIWMSALTAGLWLVVWAICLVQAWRGRRWKLPWLGAYAQRYADR